MQCTVYSVQCAASSVQRAVYSVLRAARSEQRVVCSVQCLTESFVKRLKYAEIQRRNMMEGYMHHTSKYAVRKHHTYTSHTG